MWKTRNLNPTRKKPSKPLRRHFRVQFETELGRILNPKNPYTLELPPRGRRPAPPRPTNIQPAEGAQNLLAGPSPSITGNITPSSSGFVQNPWSEASQPPSLGGQLLPPTTHPPITINTSFPVPGLIEDHAQAFAFGSFHNMYPDNLDDHGRRQPYHSTQGTTTTSDINLDALDGFAYPNSPPTAVWGAQRQHAADSYFTQAPPSTTAAASAQQTWEQQPDPQLDLTFQCQSVKIWGSNGCWEYLNAILDFSSPHSYLRSSGARKAGSRLIPVAPRHNHQGLTQYGVVTPTHYVNAYLEAEGLFGFQLRNEDVYIFPEGQDCPPEVEFIIGRNLWQAAYTEAEASAPNPLSY